MQVIIIWNRYIMHGLIPTIFNCHHLLFAFLIISFYALLSSCFYIMLFFIIILLTTCFQIFEYIYKWLVLSELRVFIAGIDCTYV